MNYYDEWANDYYIEEYDNLRRVVVGVIRHDDYRVDEFMSDIVLRKLPDVLRTWEPSKGASLDGHVRRSMKWWVFKGLRRGDVGRERYRPWSEEDDDTFFGAYGTESNLEAKELFSILKQHLTRQQMLMLQRRYVEEMTVKDMADCACCSRGAIYVRLREAMEAAKEVLDGQV